MYSFAVRIVDVDSCNTACAGAMGKVAGEKNDVVLDLSLKKSDAAAQSTVYSVLQSANDVSFSSSSTLPSSAVVTVTSSPVSQQQSEVDSIQASLVQLGTGTSGGSSDEDRTGRITCTTSLTSVAAAVTLFSSSVATITSGSPLYSNTLLTYSHQLHPTLMATAVTSVGCPPLFDLSVRSTSSTTLDTVMSTFGDRTTCSVSELHARSRVKRARQYSGQAGGTVQLLADSSSSSSSIGTSQQSIHPQHQLSLISSERCSSEPLRQQSADDMEAEDEDTAYVERRRKNNEAAKRSRDTRRLKEKHTALRAAALEQENVQLRAELAVLRNQAAKLQCVLYNKLGI